MIDLIRGRDLREARAVLRLTPSPTARLILKVVDSAAANAEANHAMDQDFLWVSRCHVDGGPAMRRLRIGSMGRGAVIRRRMSHITVVLEEREELREAAREDARRRRRREVPRAKPKARAEREQEQPPPTEETAVEVEPLTEVTAEETAPGGDAPETAEIDQAGDEQTDEGTAESAEAEGEKT